MSNSLNPQGRYKKIKKMYVKDADGSLNKIKKLQVRKPGFIEESGRTIHEHDPTYGDIDLEYNDRYLVASDEMIHLRDNLYVSLTGTLANSIYCGKPQTEHFYINLWEVDFSGNMTLLEKDYIWGISSNGSSNFGDKRLGLVRVGDYQVCVLIFYGYACSYSSDNRYYKLFDYSIPVDKSLNNTGNNGNRYFSSYYGEVSNPTMFYNGSRIKLFGFSEGGYMHNVTYNPHTHEHEHASTHYINTSRNNYNMSVATIVRLDTNVYMCGVFFSDESGNTINFQFQGFTFSATNTGFGFQGGFKDEITVATYQRKSNEMDIGFYREKFHIIKIDYNQYIFAVHDSKSTDIALLNIQLDPYYAMQSAISSHVTRLNLQGGEIDKIAKVLKVNNRIYVIGNTYKMETYTYKNTNGILILQFQLEGDEISYKNKYQDVLSFETLNYYIYLNNRLSAFYIDSEIKLFFSTRYGEPLDKLLIRHFKYNLTDGADQLYNMSRAFIDTGAHPNILVLPLLSSLTGGVGYNTPFTIGNDYPNAYNFDNGYMQMTGDSSYVYLYYYIDSADGYCFNQDLFNNTEVTIDFKISPTYTDSWFNILELEAYGHNYDCFMNFGFSWESDYIDIWGNIYDENKKLENSDIYTYRGDYYKDIADGEWHELKIRIKNYRINAYVDNELLLLTDYVGFNHKMDSIIDGYRIGLDGSESIAYSNFHHEKILDERLLL